MKQVEFERWRHFYERFPFDAMHLHYRPAAMIAQAMSSGELSDKLDWLSRPLVSDSTDADVRTMKAFGFSPGDR
ncbi:hypothetical protein QWC_31701 [Achromobacter marplatensis]|nr:hypothetical protein QWC_31701 [Achromobacter marplatensis]